MFVALIKRWYKIINTLFIKNHVSIKELESLLAVSQPTIRHSIDLLNRELENVAVITYKDNVYHLEVINKEEFEEIVTGKLKYDSDLNSSNKRHAYILKHLIESNTSLLIDDLAESSLVSRGTIFNDIAKIRKKLKPYNVDIVGKQNKGLSLQGHERNIRFVYIYCVLEYYPTEQINDRIKTFIATHMRDLNLTRETAKLLEKVIETYLIRSHLGKSLKDDYEGYIEVTRQKGIKTALISLIEEGYGTQISPFERQFLFYPFNLYSRGEMTLASQDRHYIHQMYTAMMEEVSRRFAVRFDKERLYQDIQEHLLFLNNRLRNYCFVTDLFLNDIKNKYLLAYSIATHAAEGIRRFLNRALPENEILYLSIYFEMALNNSEDNQIKNIAVICQSGMGISLIIKEKLYEILTNNITITTIPIHQIKQYALDHYFAVFSTISVDEKDIGRPIIFIRSISDRYQIRKQIEKIEKINMFNSDSLIIDLKKIRQQTGYLSIIDELLETFEAQGRLDKGFKNRLHQREKLSNTIFENSIALPHAINYQSRDLLLAIGFFDDPIMVDHRRLEIIFLIAIPEKMTEKNETVLLQLYDFIFSLANEKHHRERLKLAKSKKDIIRIIEQEDFL